MKRVLIVDDDTGFTRLFKLNIEHTREYEVKIENWPEDAVTAACRFQPHIIFLDVMMPRVFGGDVAERLRSEPQLKDVPIVFLTAAVRKERVHEHEGRISGYPFLAKPASTEEVVACIQKHLKEDQTTTLSRPKPAQESKTSDQAHEEKAHPGSGR